VLQRKIFRS